MNTKRRLSARLTLFLGAWILSIGVAWYAFSQETIKKEELADGVEHWYHETADAEKSWFFRELENLFDVLLPNPHSLPFGKSVAFLAGVSEYAKLSPQLPFVKNDLEDMRDFLLNTGGFDEVYVAREQIVNRDLIEDYMRNILPQKLGEEDRLLFYYSGHGADNRGKTGYMQFANAEKGNFAGPQVLAIKTAEDWCSELNISHLLVLFDCCASGLAFTSKSGDADAYRELIATLSRNGSRIIMTAGTAEERTFEVEGRDGHGNGVFTRAILNALQTGLADSKQDGFITASELFAQIETEVAMFAGKSGLKLTPRIWTLDPAAYSGTFVFLNPAAKTQGIALADDFSEKINATPKGGELVGAFGMIQVIAYISGQLFIDGQDVGTIEKGDARIYDQPVGEHTITIHASDQKYTAKTHVLKGETSVIAIRPTILALATPTPTPKPIKTPTAKPPTPTPVSTQAVIRLRSEPLTVSGDAEARKVFKLDEKWRPLTYIQNDFEDRGEVVIDHATGLMWQKSGSENGVTYDEAQEYIKKLNQTKFTGYDDWRLPTVSELLSLMTKEKQPNGLYISPIFDWRQLYCWSLDKLSSEVAWVVRFYDGCVYRLYMQATENRLYVRAVRS